MFWMNLGWWRLQGRVVLRHPCLVGPIFDIGEPRATSTDGFRLSRGIVAIGGLKTGCPRTVFSNFYHSPNSFPHCVIPWSLKFVVSYVSFMYLSPFDQSWHAVGVKNTKLKDRNHSSLRNWLSPSSVMQPFNNYNRFVSTISKTSFSISGTWAKAAVLTLASVR